MANKREILSPHYRADQKSRGKTAPNDDTITASGKDSTGPSGPHSYEAPTNDVIRFLTNPGLRYRATHLDHDLQAFAVHLMGGRHVLTVGHPDHITRSIIALDDLAPAGPVDDVIREAGIVLARSLTENMVAQLIEAGALVRPDPDDLPAFVPPGERVANPPTEETTHSGGVDNLQAHPEYIMDPDSKIARPVTDPGDLPLDGQ